VLSSWALSPKSRPRSHAPHHPERSGPSFTANRGYSVGQQVVVHGCCRAPLAHLANREHASRDDRLCRPLHAARTPPPMRGLVWAAAVAALLAAAPANAVQIYTFYLHVLGELLTRIGRSGRGVDRPLTLAQAGIDKNLAHRSLAQATPDLPNPYLPLPTVGNNQLVDRWNSPRQAVSLLIVPWSVSVVPSVTWT